MSLFKIMSRDFDMETVLRTNECLASTNSVKDMKFKLASDRQV